MDRNCYKLQKCNPLPPLNLSVALMYCFGVHANSVHACNAGNVNACLNRELGWRVCLALLRGTFRGTFIAV
jgi:hypothetical protein